ncbi:serine hydrolase domain-containing protein [Alteriqipengyuania lutimaris]|uniref:serine hydrolase domain-containing protein n=1 Tax=Alteriqipengyuania lutimaris TaxID=1538146 RepID=UPI001CFE93FD|nr:serine hydrolase [Alteriqipengyuania lutimaris]
MSIRIIVATFLVCLLGSAAAAQPLPRYDLHQLEAAIGKGELGDIAALASTQGGEIVYRKRFDGEAPGTPVDIKSAGKSITALAVGMAIMDGKLAGRDVAVWPYLGHSRGEPFDSITVGDLLAMASALDCDDRDRKSPGQEERMYRTREWRAFALDLPARGFTRGENGYGPFSYCTAGVFLLGQVVETATGERFDDYVQRRLFDPLGIARPIWRTSRSGEIQSGGQLTISDEALLKIGRLVLDRGEWDGRQVIDREWIEAMLTQRHALGEHQFYGDLWWATPLRAGEQYVPAWMMKGNGGNIVAVVPSHDAVLVVQTRNYNKRDAERHAFTALWAMLGALEPVTAPAIAR